MSELKKNFVQGKMNKDFDVRLIPEGEYIDAFNVLVSNSEGSQVGSIQNSFGVDKISDLSLPSNAETIGSCTDEGNECIYWAVATDSGNSYIYEYDQLNGDIISLVIGDERTSGNVLNFSKQHKITGFNVIYNSFNNQKLLIWTDYLNEIRCINISRAKSFGLATDSNNSFSSKDISLYKMQPHFAPKCVPTTIGGGLENNIKERFFSFGYRWKYLDGEYSAVSTFSNPQFYPGKFSLNYQTNENDGMINKFNAVNISFDTGDKNVTDIQLVFKESNENTIWIIDTLNKNKQYYPDNTIQTFLFSNNKIYSALPSDEVNRLFDNVPLKAKAQDYIGNRLIYGNYIIGRDMIDNNGFPVNVNYTLDVDSQSLNDIKITTSRIENAVETDYATINVFNEVTIDFSGKDINAGDVFSINFRATSPTTPVNYGGVYTCSLSMYLSNSYSNAYHLQSSSEFQNFINVIASTNFKNYDTGSNTPDWEEEGYDLKYKPFEIITQPDTDVIKLRIPYIEYKVWSNHPTGDLDPSLRTYIYKQEYFSIIENTVFSTLSNGNSYASVKSNRSYEVGIVYLDEEGRYSTVITNSHSNSFNNKFLPVSLSTQKNTLVLNIKHKAPFWAKKYKVFVKDNKLEYQTIYGLIAYKEGNYIWVKLEGQDKNKVNEGDFLILKRNLYGAIQSLTKVQVLEYKQQPKNFIDDNTGIAGNYMKLKSIGGIDIDGIENNIINRTGHVQNNGDNFFLYTGQFSIYNTSTNAWDDIPIKAGSKIDIHIQNEKLGSDGGYIDYTKSFIAGNDYVSFQDWFLTEVNDIGDFTNYSFVRGQLNYAFGVPSSFTSSSTGALYLKVKNVLNGNGGTMFNNGHPSYMDSDITITEATSLLIFETDPKDKRSEVYFETQDTYLIENGNHLSNQDVVGDVNQNGSIVSAKLNLSFFNCYTQGNGAESYVVKDLFNGNFLSTNTRPNAAELDGYKERKRISSLTYSGGFEESTNYNSLNEFNLSRINFKNLDDKYGSIQKIFSRDTDIIVFQEDKIHKVLYTKNLLSDAVGGGQITSVENILGKEIPVAGEYGIGIDPEGFAYFDNNIYFSDQPRGVILRLGADGLEPISRYGMRDWFRDNLRNYKGNFVIGGYDPSYDNYIFSFSDEKYILDNTNIYCNQSVSRIPIQDTNEINLVTDKKSGDITINYNVNGLITISVSFGRTEYTFDNLTGEDSFTFRKDVGIENILLHIQNNSEGISEASILVECPKTPELEITSLVINDFSDTGKSMNNGYSWEEYVYGYSGQSSYNDVFDSSGITRFITQVGNEADGIIPFEGAQVKVFSKKISGEFSSCNKIGYIITSDTLDAQDIIDTAIYPSVTTDGDENYITFTFTRGGDLSKKLYIVWDYIDSVYADFNNILKEVVIGQSFTINALNGVSKEDPYVISIIKDCSYGTTSISGDFITYNNNGTGYFSDYFVYRVSSGDCYEDIRVDVIVNTAVSCYSFDINNYSDSDGFIKYIDCEGNLVNRSLVASEIISGLCASKMLKASYNVFWETVGDCIPYDCKQYKMYSSSGINTIDYIDCDGVIQTASVDGSSGYSEYLFCSQQLIGTPVNFSLVGDCPSL